MIGSMYSAVSGLQAHQTKMDVIGNNIANVNTYGYKTNRATFADVFYSTRRAASQPNANQGGTNPSQIGYGAKVATIDVIHTRAGAATTNRPLDVYINGDGFIAVKTADGLAKYTRAGVLSIDPAGNLVDRNGNMVLGLPLDDTTGMPKLDKDGKAGIQSMVPVKLDPTIEYTGIEISLNGEVVAMKPGPQTLTPAPNTGWMLGSQSVTEDSLYSGEVVLTVSRDVTQKEITLPGGVPVPIPAQSSLVAGSYNPAIRIPTGAVTVGTPNTIPNVAGMTLTVNYDTTSATLPFYTFELSDGINTYYGSPQPNPPPPPPVPPATGDPLPENNLPGKVDFGIYDSASPPNLLGTVTIDVAALHGASTLGLSKNPVSTFTLGDISSGAFTNPGLYNPGDRAVPASYVVIDPTNATGPHSGDLVLTSTMTTAGSGTPAYNEYEFELTYNGVSCGKDTLSIAEAGALGTTPKTLMFTVDGIDFKITIDDDESNGIAFDATEASPAAINLGKASVTTSTASQPQTKTVNLLDTEFVAGTYAPSGNLNTPVGGVTFSAPPGQTGGPDLNGKMSLKVMSDASGNYTYTLSTFDIDGKPLELTSTLKTALGTAVFEAPNGGTVSINVGGAGSAGPVTLEIDPKSREQTINLGSAVASKLVVTGHAYQKSGDRVDFTAVEWTPTMNATANGASTFRMGDISFSVDPATFGALRDGQVQNMTVGNVAAGTSTPVKLGQVGVVTFYNQDGLSQQGEDYYLETINSGEPKAYVPGRSGTGTLLAGALEMSNVDLSREFTEMIITERGFQANTRMVTVSDEMLQELINMKR